jgi:FtsX-like permease family
VRIVLHLVVHEFRARWRGWAVLVVLVAFAGGGVLTAAAGARRTSSAYPRYLRASHASDLLVSVAGTGMTGYYAALAGQPGVALAAPGVGLSVLAGLGAPVTLTAGARLALDPGRGRAAVPVRAALAGTTLSVLAVTAAFTFGANLLTLVHTPRLYGQAWDAAVDLQFQVINRTQADERFGTNPGVTGWTFGYHGIVAVNGTIVPAIGLAPGRGPALSPTLLSGRAPRTSREIVLGTSTLRGLGLHVGQRVRVTASGYQSDDRIVGRAVFPNFGQGSFTPTDLGQGAETTAAVLRPQAEPAGGRPGFQFVLLRFRPGPGRAAAMARFQRSMRQFCATIQQSTCVVTDQRPNGVTNYARIDGTPEVLAVLLAALGVAVLGQLAVVSGRRRRHDFAILKALGLLRRQVREITAWQASILAGLALIIGVPLGLMVGRWSWHLFGDGLGIPADAHVPLPLVLVMVPAVLIVANAVAAWPGQAAARIPPAHVLRTE